MANNRSFDTRKTKTILDEQVDLPVTSETGNAVASGAPLKGNVLQAFQDLDKPIRFTGKGTSAITTFRARTNEIKQARQTNNIEGIPVPMGSLVSGKLEGLEGRQIFHLNKDNQGTAIQSILDKVRSHVDELADVHNYYINQARPLHPSTPEYNRLMDIHENKGRAREIESNRIKDKVTARDPETMRRHLMLMDKPVFINQLNPEGRVSIIAPPHLLNPMQVRSWGGVALAGETVEDGLRNLKGGYGKQIDLP
jgi:hypothetical protein